MPVAIFPNELAGPTVEIGISLHDPKQIPGVPPADTTWIKAIADTGANRTCICAAVALRAKIPVIGIGQIQSASHIVPANLYFGTLWLKGLIPNGPIYAWNFPARTFMELGQPGAGHEALLGMDILGLGVLVVSGPEGKTSFSW